MYAHLYTEIAIGKEKVYGLGLSFLIQVYTNTRSYSFYLSGIMDTGRSSVQDTPYGKLRNIFHCYPYNYNF